jgi:Ca-activated chloride channel family protein
VLLVLDVSGSMNEPIATGGTKLAAAKRALKQVADSLPPGTEVGLRVYGSKIAEPKSRNPKACTDTQLVMPLGPLDKSTMYRAVDSFTAKGETPIAYSMQKSVADLGAEGKRVLVLISDGEETCAKDPCPAARRLASEGVNLQFNAIGLAVNSKARKQLQCIAEAGGGSYYDASRSGDLSEALRKLAQRALRPFAMSGTPVRGAEEPADGPELGAGQYVDSYSASGGPRYPRIDDHRLHRQPGQSIPWSEHRILGAGSDQRVRSDVRHVECIGVVFPQRYRRRRGGAKPPSQTVGGQRQLRLLPERVVGAVAATPLVAEQPKAGPCRIVDPVRAAHREPGRTAWRSVVL